MASTGGRATRGITSYFKSRPLVSGMRRALSPARA
jgi:hypothetical protein